MFPGLMVLNETPGDSLLGTIWTDLRESPVQFVTFILFLVALSLLAPAGEFRETGGSSAMSLQPDSRDPVAPMTAILLWIDQRAEADEKTAPNAKTPTFEITSFVQPLPACFPKYSESSSLFRSTE